MEAALRTCYNLATGENPEPDAFYGIRGMDGWREASIDIAGTTVKVAVVSGLGNARRLIEAVRKKKVFYHFVEVMGLPGRLRGRRRTADPRRTRDGCHPLQKPLLPGRKK